MRQQQQQKKQSAAKCTDRDNITIVKCLVVLAIRVGKHSISKCIRCIACKTNNEQLPTCNCKKAHRHAIMNGHVHHTLLTCYPDVFFHMLISRAGLSDMCCQICAPNRRLPYRFASATTIRQRLCCMRKMLITTAGADSKATK